MERNTVETIRHHLYLLLLAGVAVGLLLSPPVLSIGLIGLVVIGLLDPREGLNPRWKAGIAAWLRSPVPWALLALYLLLLAGFWQTEDWPYYLERLRIKIPLLGLPIIWPGLPKLSTKDRGRVAGGFAALLAVILTGALVNYALNFAEVNRLVYVGQAVPVPRNHIRFSLLVATAVFFALRARELRGFGCKAAWWVVAAYLFIGLHLLAVRSGLAGAYGGAGVFMLVTAWRRGSWWPATAAMIGLFLLPILAYLTLPSFKTKMDYARYELFHRDRSVDTNEYSDEGRLASINIGLDIWRDHRLVGVGPGNLLRETDRRYAVAYPGKEGKRPHNQFVSALAGSGLLGGIVTLGAFGLLAWAGLRRRAPVYLAVWTIFFLSCLVENTLENTVGVSTVPLMFLLLYEWTGGGATTPSPSRDPLP